MKQARKRIVAITVLASLALLLASSVVFRSRGQTEWAFAIDSADAGFYTLNWEEQATNLYAPKYVSREYILGILKIYSRRREESPFVGALGTSLVAAGTSATVPIVLFHGAGTSPTDIAAIENILKGRRLDYVLADSTRLNQISAADLQRFRLLIVPGGDFLKIGMELTTKTTANVRSAVQGGLNYLGICAGGFLAGDTGKNGFNFTGVRFPFYAAEDQGIRKAAVPIAIPGGPTIEHYWEDGPQFTGWGAVVAKYPDGSPAVVQGRYGKGWLLLSGFHPEAPANWRQAWPSRLLPAPPMNTPAP